MVVAVALALVLLGLILASITVLRESADREEVEARLQLIERAMQDYRTEYGRWPCQDQGQRDRTYTNSACIVTALLNNPKRRPFIELDDIESDRGMLLDPWSRSYVVATDDNGDGVVRLCCTNAGIVLSTALQHRAVAVMSWGPSPDLESDRILSWTR
jgi:type II secretory pathway pseudopilin PulG